MNLSDFEDIIENVILERGMDYFENGHVTSLEEIKKDCFTATVDGSGTYKVKIVIGPDDSIMDTDCNCPYDWSEFCKHKAAVLFALRERKVNKIVPVNTRTSIQKPDLQTVLAGKSKEELIHIIHELSERNPDIEQTLMFKYAPGKDDISAIKKMIKEYINKSKHRGFIDWRSTGFALQGANIALDKARSRKVNGETESAVLLCIAVLPIAVDMLQYSDDSNGDVGDVIRESVALLNESVSEGIGRLSGLEQKNLFAALLKESKHKRYDGWGDWAFDLLNACVYFCGIPDLRSKLEKHLESVLNQANSSSWSAEYNMKQVLLLKYEIIERWDGPDAAESFIKEHLHISEFREKAVNIAFQKEEYQKVIQLCLDGEDTENRSYRIKWEKYRYEAYEKLGDVPCLKKLAFELVFEGEFAYFLKLKNLYQVHEEWQSVLAEIISKFKEKRNYLSIYESILIEEKQTELLLEYCKGHVSYIERLYPYLIEDCLHDVNLLFIQFIEEMATEAGDRKKYKKVCSKIKLYKKVCGDLSARLLIDSLKQKYPRRPSLLDELGKIK